MGLPTTPLNHKEPSETESPSYPYIFNYRRERRDSFTHAYQSGDLIVQTNRFQAFARILANTAETKVEANP